MYFMQKQLEAKMKKLIRHSPSLSPGKIEYNYIQAHVEAVKQLNICINVGTDYSNVIFPKWKFFHHRPNIIVHFVNVFIDSKMHP